MQEFLWWFRLFLEMLTAGASTYCAVMLFHAWLVEKQRKSNLAHGPEVSE